MKTKKDWEALMKEFPELKELPEQDFDDEFPDEWKSHSSIDAVSLAVMIQRKLSDEGCETEILQNKSPAIEADFSLHPTLEDFSVAFINKPWGCDTKVAMYEHSIFTHFFLDVWKDLVKAEIVWGGRYKRKNLLSMESTIESLSSFKWRQIKELSEEKREWLFVWCVFDNSRDEMASIINIAPGYFSNIISDLRIEHSELNIPDGNTDEKRELAKMLESTLPKYATQKELDWYGKYKDKFDASTMIRHDKKNR